MCILAAHIHIYIRTYIWMCIYSAGFVKNLVKINSHRQHMRIPIRRYIGSSVKVYTRATGIPNQFRVIHIFLHTYSPNPIEHIQTQSENVWVLAFISSISWYGTKRHWTHTKISIISIVFNSNGYANNLAISEYRIQSNHITSMDLLLFFIKTILFLF